MENILVIGATGNIGLPLIRHLMQKPDVQPIAGVHNVARAEKMLGKQPNIILRQFDFLNPKTFDTALKDVQRVFFIRPPQLAKPKEDMFPFLETLKRKQIQQVVFVYLIGVEKNPMTPHHKIEAKIRALNLPYTFIRPSFFMQNLSTTHRYDIIHNHDLFIPVGHRAKTSFIDTRDIGAAAAKVLTAGKTYINEKLDITGAEALTYDEVAQIMTQELGTTITYSNPSPLKFRRTLLKRGLKKDFVNVMVMLYVITRMGNAKQITSTLQQVLGRDPISFRQFVQDHQHDFLA